MILANQPERQSWIEVTVDCDFPIQNIPFGIYQHPVKGPSAATRIGNTLIDLPCLAQNGFLNGTGAEPTVFHNNFLNEFIALGQPVWRAVREIISEIFEAGNPLLRDNLILRSEILSDATTAEMLMPVKVGDYTDFYSSIEHATNVGIMFRDAENPLLPNWRHIPVGYHGRSSSIVVSGTSIHRPKGQIKSDAGEYPVFSPSHQLDFELELAFVTGKATVLGESVSTADAADYIFGMVLFNDLSARDIQRWEYIPLGPFLSKNFGSVVSPWIVTLEALEPFRTSGPVQQPEPLPYLQFQGKENFNINLEVLIRPESQPEQRICSTNYKYMYWNMAQQLAHHTVNGCNINVGDMYGSGTISGPTTDSFGSMLELAWKGTKPIKLADGSERKFIHDYDTIIMRGYAQKDKLRIGFGEAVTKILPANK
ncbi:MAG: fumarylacetoacetase [Bacteroidia bacterium]|nr:fumarylacetoacetase [Bacteroidia bacterium]